MKHSRLLWVAADGCTTRQRADGATANFGPAGDQLSEWMPERVCRFCGSSIFVVDERPGLFGWFTVLDQNGFCPFDAMAAAHQPESRAAAPTDQKEA